MAKGNAGCLGGLGCSASDFQVSLNIGIRAEEDVEVELGCLVVKGKIWWEKRSRWASVDSLKQQQQFDLKWGTSSFRSFLFSETIYIKQPNPTDPNVAAAGALLGLRASKAGEWGQAERSSLEAQHYLSIKKVWRISVKRPSLKNLKMTFLYMC